MGTTFSLTVGGMEVDRSATPGDIDHGMLFQGADLAGCMHFSRSLRHIAPQLDLLGVTLDIARQQYEVSAAEWRSALEFAGRVASHSAGGIANFDEFVDYIRRHPVCRLDDRVNRRFSVDAVAWRLPGIFDASAYSERSHFAELMSVVGPHAMLRVLAECPENLDADVIWACIKSSASSPHTASSCCRNVRTCSVRAD